MWERSRAKGLGDGGFIGKPPLSPSPQLSQQCLQPQTRPAGGRAGCSLHSILEKASPPPCHGSLQSKGEIQGKSEAGEPISHGCPERFINNAQAQGIPCTGSARGHGGTAPCSQGIPACRTDTFLISAVITLLGAFVRKLPGSHGPTRGCQAGAGSGTLTEGDLFGKVGQDGTCGLRGAAWSWDALQVLSWDGGGDGNGVGMEWEKGGMRTA